MSPAHRQSCDRCRQQKVRCLRDNSSSPTCDRCAKAGAECRYSEKQRGQRRRCVVRSPSEIDSTDLFGLGQVFGHHVGAMSRPSTGATHVMTALMDHHPSDVHIDQGEVALGGFAAPDAEHQMIPLEMPSASRESLATLLAETSMSGMPFYDAAVPDPPMESYVDDEEDTRSLLFSQLTAVSQRAMRTARRLTCSSKGAKATNLVVSSPEVNEALEDTNTLISTINDIMTAVATAGCDDSMTTTDAMGLAFSALACHQNLMTLFRAICDVIRSRLQAKKEEQDHKEQPQQQQQLAVRDNSGVGPLNVAQFVMVLQLLLHLITRMGRILEVSNTATIEQESQFLAPTAMALDCSTMVTDEYAVTMASGHSSASSSATSTSYSPLRSGLLEHVQDIVGNIASEHESLRRTIQQLQAEMDHAEIH